MKKLSFWDILATLVVVSVLGLAVVFLNIFINPYSSLNPFPPATKIPATTSSALTQTQQTLPGIWTGTPGTLLPSTATLIPSTATLAGPIYVLPTWTASPFPYKTPNYTLTAYFARQYYTATRTLTPTRTVTPFVPTATGIPCVTNGINVYCDDTRTGSIKYYGTWDTYAGNGPYNNTAHYSSNPDSSVTFTFTGSKVTYIFPTYYTRGHAGIYIDGVYVTTISLNTPELRWQQLWDSPVLANGTHSITLVVVDGTIDLDGFIVNRTGAALTNTPGAPVTATFTLTPVHTSTFTPTATNTNTAVVVPPTATYTNTAVVIPPTATNTNTAVVIPPTATNTDTVVVPPTNTDTPVPVVPTNTDTPVPVIPTNTDTPVPVVPTNTNTAVPVPPTMTDTVVVVPPTETPTLTFTAVVSCSLLYPTQTATATATLEPTPTGVPPVIPVACTITGNAGAGTTITITGDPGAQITQPDGSGNYSIAIPNNWSGTITPIRIGYTFSPANFSPAMVVANISGFNFTPTNVGTFNLTGNAGVNTVLTVTSGAVVAQQPDASGNYIVTVTAGWTGTITPHHATCTFTPPDQTYPGGVGMDLPGQNFTQTCPP